MDVKQALLDDIARFYLSSGDFNGIPVRQLAKARFGLTWESTVSVLAELIAEGRIGVLFSDTELNTHILRLGFEPPESQIAKLPTADAHACAYPTPKHLGTLVDPADYQGRPYVLCLALGSAQLDYRAFDISILEVYRNDPRYYYSVDDISGLISASDDSIKTGALDARDSILLDTFGFCYDEELTRAVAVYLRYLADLSPEHQQFWKARELEGEYKLHPDYFRRTVLGAWGEGISVFAAFIEELQVINKMAEAMGRARLFRSDFSGGERPREFGFLIRPTLGEYNGFVQLLDKMISDNIDLKFFRNEVPYEREEARRDGKVVVVQRGSISILDEWLRTYFSPDDWQPVEQMISAFREVRRMRQRPAHAIDENVYDHGYVREQRGLISRAYGGVRTLRLILANHPLAKGVVVPSSLTERRIWTY